MIKQEAINLMHNKYPEYTVATCAELPEFFVCSLRHKSMPPEASTGGICYLVFKTTKQIEAASIYDPRLY